jgi:hypothetical protein
MSEGEIVGQEQVGGRLEAIEIVLKKISDRFAMLDEIQRENRDAPTPLSDASAVYISGKWKRRDGDIFPGISPTKEETYGQADRPNATGSDHQGTADAPAQTG